MDNPNPNPDLESLVGVYTEHVPDGVLGQLHHAHFNQVFGTIIRFGLH